MFRDESTRFLLQMAGRVGAGKSTLARAVAAAIGAVILDHDTTKSAVLAAGVPHPPAGAVSYEVIFELASDLLAQGHAVIIDSPSAYESIPDRGMKTAGAAGVGYYFVECACPDGVADERVEERQARPSQVASKAEAAEVSASATRRPHRPARGTIVVDTTRPVDASVAEVVAYLATAGASGPAVPTPRPS